MGVGVAISYLIIIGDLMPQVITGFNKDAENIEYLMDRRFWITAFMYCPLSILPLCDFLTSPCYLSRLVVIPLSFLRRLDSLKYTSFIALVSIGYLVIIVVAHFLIGDTWAERGNIRPFIPAGPIEVLSTFPVIVFAYTCHQNVSAPSALA